MSQFLSIQQPPVLSWRTSRFLVTGDPHRRLRSDCSLLSEPVLQIRASGTTTFKLERNISVFGHLRLRWLGPFVCYPVSNTIRKAHNLLQKTGVLTYPVQNARLPTAQPTSPAAHPKPSSHSLGQACHPATWYTQDISPSRCFSHHPTGELEKPMGPADLR